MKTIINFENDKIQRMKINSILLIEDDDLTASLNELILTDLKVSKDIIIKTEPEEGLRFIKESCERNCCPDLIFVDIKMPGLTGLELIEELNKFKASPLFHSKVVVLTSSSFVKDVDKAKELNVDGYLLKPLNKDKVYTLLEKYFS